MRQLAFISIVVITVLSLVVFKHQQKQHLRVGSFGLVGVVVVGGVAAATSASAHLVDVVDDRSDSSSSSSSLLLESASSVDIENILRKPYEQVCEQEASDDALPELQIDQTRPECPLPLNSSSRQTGCTCHFDSSRIECIYADRLAKLPLFAAASTYSSYGNGDLSNGNRNDSNGGISWSIDLRYSIFQFFSIKYVPWVKYTVNSRMVSQRDNTKSVTLIS